jgi:hypothetical protein
MNIRNCKENIIKTSHNQILSIDLLLTTPTAEGGH